jgi:hypothetical protein
MGKFQGVRRISLTVSFSLIITFALLIHADFAGAGGLGRIGPNQGFDTTTLLPKAVFQFDLTQSTAFGTHGIRVVSLKNKELKTTLVPKPSSFGTPGWWILMTFSYESNSFHSDFAFGLTSNEASYPTVVDLAPGIGVAISIGIVSLAAPPAEDPFQFTIALESIPSD